MTQFLDEKGFQVTVGFPEFAQGIYYQYKSAFEVIKELESLQKEILIQPPSEPFHKVVRHLVKMNANSLGAVMVLVLNGYGNDAMKVARGMFEACVNVCYLQMHPDERQDFFDFFWVRQFRQLQHLDELDPDSVVALPEQTAQIKAEFAKIESRFRMKNGRLRASWCKRDLAARAKEVEMLDHYHTFYAWASSMHHVDIGGVVSQADGNDADVAPSAEWIDTALITGHMSVLRTLGAFNEIASLGMESGMQRAMNAFVDAWPGNK